MEAAESRISSELQRITLRRAVAGDAQGIGAVFDAAVRDGWTFLGELARRPMFWHSTGTSSSPTTCRLMRCSSRPTARTASSASRPFTEVGEMFLLFVDPAHAGRGVGRVLLNAAHDVLRAAGRTEAFLFTEERSARARAVYAAAGYRPDGTVRESDFDGAALRELRLVKAL